MYGSRTTSFRIRNACIARAASERTVRFSWRGMPPALRAGRDAGLEPWRGQRASCGMRSTGVSAGAARANLLPLSGIRPVGGAENGLLTAASAQRENLLGKFRLRRGAAAGGGPPITISAANSWDRKAPRRAPSRRADRPVSSLRVRRPAPRTPVRRMRRRCSGARHGRRRRSW